MYSLDYININLKNENNRLQDESDFNAKDYMEDYRYNKRFNLYQFIFNVKFEK